MNYPEEKRLQFAAETVMDCLFGRYRPGFVDAKNIVNSERRGGRKEVGGVLNMHTCKPIEPQFRNVWQEKGSYIKTLRCRKRVNNSRRNICLRSLNFIAPTETLHTLFTTLALVELADIFLIHLQTIRKITHSFLSSNLLIHEVVLIFMNDFANDLKKSAKTLNSLDLIHSHKSAPFSRALAILEERVVFS